jgi:hypothetical protein
MRYLTRAVRILLATSLSFWIAGAGCLLGCEGMTAAAERPLSASANLVVSGDVCSSGESHHCCSRQKTSAQLSHPRPEPLTHKRFGGNLPSSGMHQCPFAVSRSLVTAKSDGGNSSALQPIAVTQFSVQPVAAPHLLLVDTPRPASRGHTYLRCCVFLI